MRHKSSFFSGASWPFAAIALALAGGACAPKLGDSCKEGIDCDVRNQRVCDRAQPGGYCTILNCKPGDCGDDGVCVRFRPDEPRLSSTYCMLKCDETKDCNRDDYLCRNAEQVNRAGEEQGATFNLAEVLDGSGKAKFCLHR